MKNTYDHIDDLIAKYIAEEATADEIRFVESWLEASEENKKYFQQLRTIFTRTPGIKHNQQFDADAAWDKVRSKLTQGRDHKTFQLKPDNKFNLFWKIAASILVLLTAGIFTYKLLDAEKTKSVEVIAEKHPEADTLPDGSNVFLNKKTKLSYAFDKKKNTHRVKLEGEAYFNIKHDDQKHFVIDAAGVYIKDIGTSFNVKAYPDSATIEVVVEEGEVMFYTEKDSGIYLRKNGRGVYNKKTGKFDVKEPEPNITAYKTKFFIFSNTDLATVVKTLNAVYDKRIIIGKHLAACHLTVTFNEENVDVIANVIAETLGLTVKQSDQLIFLEGTGCTE